MIKINDFLQCILWPLYGLYLFIRNFRFYLRYPILFSTDFFLKIYYQTHYSFAKNHLEKASVSYRPTELTYGETPYMTIKSVLDFIPINTNSVFYDLGCGKGRLAFFVRFVYKIPVVGIELLPTYVKVATLWAKRHNWQNIRFIQGNMLKADLSAGTIFFIAGTCLESKTQTQLAQKLESLTHPCYVITTSYPIKSDRFRIIKILKQPFSWGYGTVYIQKNTPPSPCQG